MSFETAKSPAGRGHCGAPPLPVCAGSLGTPTAAGVQRLEKTNHLCGGLVLLDETVDYGLSQLMVFAMCCFSDEKYKELLFVSY